MELLTEPYAIAAVTAAVVAALYWQRTLSWREYRTIHGLKRRVCPLLDGLPGLPSLVNDKQYRAGEYVAHSEWSVAEIFAKLVASGGSPHLINSLKRRELPYGRGQLTAAHVVWTHDDGTQTEAFLFQSADGGTDVYAHHEDSVTSPREHLDGSDQVDGDPRGVVHHALGMERHRVKS